VETECRLCGSSSCSPIHCDNDNTLYHSCSVCGLVFMDVKSILPAADEKSRYQLHDNTLDNKGYVKMLTGFLEKGVVPYLDQGASLLDFGSGPGPVLQTLLQRRGYDVDIYDPFFAPERVFAAKEYDGITATEVLEHFSDPASDIALLCSCLRTDGILAIRTEFLTDLAGFCNWWYRQDETHVAFYSSKTLRWIEENFPLKLLACRDGKIAVFRKHNR